MLGHVGLHWKLDIRHHPAQPKVTNRRLRLATTISSGEHAEDTRGNGTTGIRTNVLRVRFACYVMPAQSTSGHSTHMRVPSITTHINDKMLVNEEWKNR